MKKLTLLEINNKAIRVIKSIRMLEAISWPSKIETDFLISLINRKRVSLKFNYPKFDCSEKKYELKKLLPHLSKENPLHIFTASTINSYINSLYMIESVGTPTFQELSISEYGSPHHLLFGSKFSHLKTAEMFLSRFHDYDHPYIKEKGEVYTAKQLKAFLSKEALKTFDEHTPKFVISKKMIAKAAASKSKVRIRSDAEFSRVDFKNLLVHELFTHSLTGINGALQNKLPLLGFGAPRTTKTQEGLATFAEVMSGLLDINRLKRLSLRVMGIDKAMSGANIYELFDFFKSHGQNDLESFFSVSRIFRGGYPKGGIVFTKDGVYLEGLIRIHSLFRWAFKTMNLDILHLLFIGRLDINDIFLLNESYKNKLLFHPRYLPEWYQNTDLLAGKMAFSLILNDISLSNVESHYESKIFNR